MSVNSVPLVNDSLITYTVIISNGADIVFPSATTISLASPHTYLVSYIVNAEFGTNAEMSIVPRINGIDQLSFSCTSETGTAFLIANASGTFLLNTILFAPPVTLQFAYYGTAVGSDPSGSFSIVQIS